MSNDFKAGLEAAASLVELEAATEQLTAWAMARRLKQIAAHIRALKATAGSDGLRKDAARWRKISGMMVHQHSGPNDGWTLDVLLPGDDPDKAIDVWLKGDAR